MVATNATVVLFVAALFLSAATCNVIAADHNCDDYSNDRSDYMKNTCSNGGGGKELPPPGQGPEGCDRGTLRCQSQTIFGDLC